MDTSLQICLISESVNSTSPPHRMAAVQLAQAIRVGGEDIGASVEKLLATWHARDVDAEVRGLIEKYQIPDHSA